MLRFYKPNPKNTGHAASLYYSTNYMSIFLTMVKQDSWDAAKRIGSFAKNVKNVEKTLTLKLSLTEAAGLIDAIERNTEFSGFHDSGRENSVSFKFAQYEYGGKLGYSLSVTRTNKTDTTKKTSFLIGFSMPETRLIKEHLIYLIHERFRDGDEQARKQSPRGKTNDAPEIEAGEPLDEPPSDEPAADQAQGETLSQDIKL